MPSYMHVGNPNNIANKVKSIFMGNSDNKAVIVKSIFMGNSDGKATGGYQRVYTTTVTYYTSSVEPGNMSSTTALTRASTSATSYLTRSSASGTGSTTTSGSNWYVSKLQTQLQKSTSYNGTSTNWYMYNSIQYFGQNFKYTSTSYYNGGAWNQSIRVSFSRDKFYTYFTVTSNYSTTRKYSYSLTNKNTYSSMSTATYSNTRTLSTSYTDILVMNTTTGPLATPAATYAGSYTFSTTYYNDEYYYTYTNASTIYNTLSYKSEIATSTCIYFFSDKITSVNINNHSNSKQNNTYSYLTSSSSQLCISYTRTYSQKVFADKNITYTYTYNSSYGWNDVYTYKYTQSISSSSGGNTFYTTTRTYSYNGTNSYDETKAFTYNRYNQSSISGLIYSRTYASGTTKTSTYQYATYISSSFGNSILLTTISSANYTYMNLYSRTTLYTRAATLVTATTSQILAETYLTRSSTSGTSYLTRSSTSGYTGVSTSTRTSE